MADFTFLVNATEAHVRSLMEGESSGHDWWHTDRVRRTADWIARQEGAAAEIVELAALLHDVDDWKFADGDLNAGPAATRQWLLSIGAGTAIAESVARIVADVSFKGAGVDTTPDTLEGQVVQDADRLDAIGAIGIGRAFAYGGSRGRPMHDPAHAPRLHGSFDDYRSSTSPTISHFHEKLLLLKDRLHTPSARRLAADRHTLMEEFLSRFEAEWEGHDLNESGSL